MKTPLIKNTLIFLDTGFFKNYKVSDPYYNDLLKLSREENVLLFTSHFCIEEWRYQKINHLNDFLTTTNNNYRYQLNANIIADDIIGQHPLRIPDSDEIEKRSQNVIKVFVKENKINIFMPTTEHISRTWTAYFKGLPPFLKKKNKKDIPDSWIFEAARDVRFKEELKKYAYRYCIGSDKNLKKHFSRLGLKPVSTPDFMTLMEQEREQKKETVSDKNLKSNAMGDADKGGVQLVEYPPNDLEIILNAAISDVMREIFLRLLGYTYWLNKPSKNDLFQLIQEKGYSLDLIEAAALILTQESLGLIKDTGNHILPVNKKVCSDAGDRVKLEIIGLL